MALLNKEYPVFSYAARIVSLTDNERIKIYTSPICLAIDFFFAEKNALFWLLSTHALPPFPLPSPSPGQEGKEAADIVSVIKCNKCDLIVFTRTLILFCSISLTFNPPTGYYRY